MCIENWVWRIYSGTLPSMYSSPRTKIMVETTTKTLRQKYGKCVWMKVYYNWTDSLFAIGEMATKLSSFPSYELCKQQRFRSTCASVLSDQDRWCLQYSFNPFSQTDSFCSRQFLKKSLQKEKFVMMHTFSFCHNFVNPLPHTSILQ